MRNKPLMFVWAGALIFGLVAAFSVTRYLNGSKKEENLNSIMVAKMEIPVGATITPEALVAVSMPPEAIPEGAFTQADALTGRVAATRIAARSTLKCKWWCRGRMTNASRICCAN